LGSVVVVAAVVVDGALAVAVVVDAGVGAAALTAVAPLEATSLPPPQATRAKAKNKVIR